MKKHTRIYLEGMGYDQSDWIPCEVGKEIDPDCQVTCVDVHHVHARGMGGSNSKDRIENLMGMCRHCHIKYGDKKQFKVFLVDLHNTRMNERRVVRHFG